MNMEYAMLVNYDHYKGDYRLPKIECSVVYNSIYIQIKIHNALKRCIHTYTYKI